MIKVLLLISLHYDLCNEIYFKLSKKNGSEDNLAVCSLLIEDSIKNDIDASLVLSVAWEESRFTQQSTPTKYKCVGPMQIKYQYWCPNKNNKISAIRKDGLISKCDVYDHGVKSLKYYIKKFSPLNKALCYYNNSKKCSKNKKYLSSYVVRVLSYRKKIKKVMKSLNSL